MIDGVQQVVNDVILGVATVLGGWVALQVKRWVRKQSEKADHEIAKIKDESLRNAAIVVVKAIEQVAVSQATKWIGAEKLRRATDTLQRKFPWAEKSMILPAVEAAVHGMNADTVVKP